MFFEPLILILISLDYFSKNKLFKINESKFFLFGSIISMILSIIVIIFDVLPLDKVNHMLIILLFLINVKRNHFHINIDPLTKIFNRHSFNNSIANRRSKTHMVAILYLDLNNFKSINDQFGHNEGDKVLEDVAKLLKSSIRKNDGIYRIGGDEFVIMTKIKREEYVRKIIAKINDQIEEFNKTYRHKISLSIGYSLANSNENLEEVVKKADKHMYENKMRSKIYNSL